MAVAGERCGVPYARREGGLGTAFLAGGTRIQTLIATILAVAAAIVFAGPTGIVLLAVAGATALVVGQFATSRLGGVTGDVYGAVNELATMAMFVVAALLTVGDILPFEPSSDNRGCPEHGRRLGPIHL